MTYYILKNSEIIDSRKTCMQAHKRMLAIISSKDVPTYYLKGKRAYKADSSIYQIVIR